MEEELLVVLRDPAAGKRVKAFAGQYGLKASRVSAGATMVIRGPVAAISRAFGKKPRVPKGLADAVDAVFGMDERHVAKRPGRRKFPPPESEEPPPVNAHTKPPEEFRELYQFPEHATGKGECIAVLQFGGGFERRKLSRYLKELGVKAPKIVVRQLGRRGRNRPSNLPGKLTPDAEVYMDLEILASVAPDATLVVYFASNTRHGWVHALHTAIFDKRRPSVISISWGNAEQFWDEQTVRAMEAALRLAAAEGITVCCSSGDRGVFEAEKAYTVAYPASSVFALACGGTKLDADGMERVWNASADGFASGGGISQIFGPPEFQQGHAIPPHATTRQPGRGIPDVAANASAATGYLIISDETPMSLGGTSAATPLWAGLIACLNGVLGRRIGHLTPLLYTGKPGAALRDIRRGTNQLEGRQGYRARKGWDGATGLGSPHGVKLLAWLEKRLAKAPGGKR